MIRGLTALAFALLLAPATSAAAGAADDLPYLGDWECPGGPTLSIGVWTYDSGEGVLEIRSIERDGRSFILTMADGYGVGLSMDGDRAMAWLSMASGDGFDCRRTD